MIFYITSKGKQYTCYLDDEFSYLVEYFTYHIAGGYLKRVTSIKIGKRKTITMQSDVLGYREGFVIDHINHNRTDNRKVNLRHVTEKENSRNKSHIVLYKGKIKSSRYIGVTFDKIVKRKCWHAYAMVDGKRISFGRYATEFEAALARDIGAKKYFGEHTVLNFKES